MVGYHTDTASVSVASLFHQLTISRTVPLLVLITPFELKHEKQKDDNCQWFYQCDQLCHVIHEATIQIIHNTVSWDTWRKVDAHASQSEG